ncbi:vacuolar import and degradation protein 27 [Monosporozyma unispora]|nr:hypothetical protein C6P44_000076 [Kazachstania unispora]
MNILKKFMDSGNKQELSVIASGEFDLLRSKQSPKSSLECIYNDSSLSIRSNGQYTYNIVVKKVIDITEDDEGDEDGDGYYSDDARSVLSVQSKIGGKKEEEWSFTLGPHLNFKKTWSNIGDAVFVWNNSLGDENDERVQYVISSDVSTTDVDQFLQILYRCYFTVINKKPISSATANDIKDIELLFNTVLPEEENEETIPDSCDLLDTLHNLNANNAAKDSDDDEGDTSELFQDANDTFTNRTISAPLSTATEIEGKEISSYVGGLYLFDPIKEDFLLQEHAMEISLIEIGEFKYWLSVNGKETKLGKPVTQQLNPTFDDAKTVFIFNYTIEQITLSFMIKFDSINDYKSFKLQWSACLWMATNKVSWDKVSDKEKQYIINPTLALVKDLDHILGFGDDSDDKREEELRSLEQTRAEAELEEDEDDEDIPSSVLVSSEQFDESSSASSSGNRSLTVSARNDRSYVVRGNKIGVFKTGAGNVEDDDEDGLEFVSVIKSVKGKDGKGFNPENPMMYMEDRSLILGDNNNLNKLYKMDIETGKIVEEWGSGDKNIVQYGPTKKYDQLTSEPTVVGVSNNTLFKMDPRIPNENKIVQDQSKQYATKYNFSSIGTTEDGYVAVGSEKGDIKLYDRLGIKAKTAIPSLGEPIKYITTSADGNWLLATCETSLLLIDLTIKTGKNAGNIGFLKSFPAAENVKTYILRVSPEHTSYMRTYTKKPISFTRAYFNVGIGQKEQNIITSTGPFAITWSLNKIIQHGTGNNAYYIKRYDNDIVEDNFKFGSRKRVIVALKDDISLSKLKSFKQPNKDVLMPQSNIKEFYE